MGNGSIIPVNDQQTTGAKVEPALSSQQHYQPQQGYNSAQVGSGANIPRRDQPISTDSDLEGAELNKEARFWKVYVKEADQYDTDLVDGWNKSLDVILGGIVFGRFNSVRALEMGAIRFIIESSKKLIQDPGDTSMDALRLISQTLLAIASNTSVENLLTGDNANSTSTFVPSQAAVIVNTLWYTSLALSLATSFIAMLAKEWCRLFLANRTGDSYSQAQRRQEKWIMIKRWKMQELFILLPSLIHLALLLFVIGLCINVWELNTTVAIPIIIISSTAALFYIWSSIAPGLMKFYPYTTLIFSIFSAISTSKIAALIFRIAYFIFSVLSIVLRVGFQVVITWLWPIPVFLALMELLWRWLLRIFYNFVIFPFRIYYGLLQALHFCIPGYCRRPSEVKFAGDETGIWLNLGWLPKRITHPITTLPDRISGQLPLRRAVSRIDHQGKITSLALQWLLENCETSSSLAIALQAIAGASSKHPSEPLNQCDASLKILQQLVSGNPERLEIQRYTRALQFLGHGNASDQSTQASGHAGELEVMLWELHSSNESYVSNLITHGRFIANDHSISALRLGSMAAVRILTLLKEHGELDPTILGQITNTIQRQLHPAASVSLIHAVTLISAASPRHSFNDGVVIARSCIEILQQELPVATTSEAVLLTRVRQLQPLICVLALGRPENEPLSHMTPRVGGVVRTLYEATLMSQREMTLFLSAGITEMLSKPDYYFLESSRAQMVSPDRPISEASVPGVFEGDARIEAIKSIYRVTQTDQPALPNYLRIVEYICSATESEQHELGELISRFRFPQLSRELIELLTEYDIISRLQPSNHNRPSSTMTSRHSLVWHNRRDVDPTSFFSTAVLWLLGALLGDLKFRSYSREQQDLHKILGWDQQRRGSERHNLEARILDICNEIVDNTDSPSIYMCRIVECILETGRYNDTLHYHRLMPYVQNRLTDVPSRLRGLNSFTSRNTWRIILQGVQPPRPSHVELKVIPPSQHQRRTRPEPGPRLR